jgi:hypothetical protein
MWKTMQASEREERAAEKEMRKAEMERDVKMRELDLMSLYSHPFQ